MSPCIIPSGNFFTSEIYETECKIPCSLHIDNAQNIRQQNTRVSAVGQTSIVLTILTFTHEINDLFPNFDSWIEIGLSA